jgi:hypothetical protein
MTGRPFSLWLAWPPPVGPHPSELLFEVLRGTDRFTCKLLYQDKWGVEAQFLKNEVLLIRRRFELREQAVRWAQEMRIELEKGAMP